MNFEVDTNPLGHEIFAYSNKQGTQIADEFYIDAGKAEEKRAKAAAFIKRVGAYINPVADKSESDSAYNALSVTATLGGLTAALSAILL